MAILTGLLSLIIILIIAAYVGQPFFSEKGSDSTVQRKQVAALWERARLLGDRNSIYADLRSLDFDRETGKVTVADYESQRYQLVSRGVESLQQLDALPVSADDPIETMIRSVQSAVSDSITETDSTFCSQCGEQVATDDRFCGSCGAKLG